MKNKHELWELEWSKRQFAMLRDGGTWAIPRSGMILQRTKTGFDLIALMPVTEEMAKAFEYGADVPETAEDLLSWQRQDFDQIKSRFEAAELTFTDSKNLLKKDG